MEPKIYEEISKKIDELNALLDAANAQAMSTDQVRGRQLLSTKLHSASGSALQTLLDRPTLYTDSIDRKLLGDLLTTYDKIPGLSQKLDTCANKTKGWRIATGQNINATMLRLYRKLGADVPDMPDLRTLYDSLVAIFKIGKRKPRVEKPNGNGTSTGQNGDAKPMDDSQPDA